MLREARIARTVDLPARDHSCPAGRQRLTGGQARQLDCCCGAPTFALPHRNIRPPAGPQQASLLDPTCSLAAYRGSRESVGYR